MYNNSKTHLFYMCIMCAQALTRKTFNAVKVQCFYFS